MAIASDPPPRSIATTRGAWSAVGVALLTLTTVGLGLLRLESRSIWGDEAISISYARRSLSGLHASVLGDPNMSLYYALLWVWVRVFGDSLLAIKSMSVLFAALTVPVVYGLGARLFGRRAGLVAALLLTTNAFFLTFAQEARGYSLVTLLTALSMYLFVRALEEPSRVTFCGYVVASAAAFHAHFFAVYITFVQVGVLVAVKRRDALSLRWLLSYAAMGALVAPIAYQALGVEPDPIGWIPRPGWHTLSEIARNLAGNSTAEALALLAVIAIALPQLARSTKQVWLILTSAWLLVPTVVSFVVSQTHPLLLPRYVVISVPALALLAGGAIVNIRPERAVAPLVAALVLLSPYPLWTWYHRPAIEDWKGAATFILSRAQPSDGVAYQMSRAVPAVTYYERHGKSRPSLDWGARRVALPSRAERRIWLVSYPSGEEAQRLRSTLRALGLARIARRDFHGDIRVELFSRSVMTAGATP